MSRSRWRVSRALRVLLACLVLWLPARSAGASYAPTDPVVMIAGGAAAIAVKSPSPSANASAACKARRVAADGRHAATRSSLSRLRKRLTGRSTASTNRAPAPPLYLLHCALRR